METINYLSYAEGYYAAMIEKDFEKMASHLDENVEFIGPLAKMYGRGNVVDAAKNLMEILQKIEIRERFQAGNKVMLAYDFIFSAPLGLLRAAVLMEFKAGLISRIELFYDGAQMAPKKEEIFD